MSQDSLALLAQNPPLGLESPGWTALQKAEGTVCQDSCSLDPWICGPGQPPSVGAAQPVVLSPGGCVRGLDQGIPTVWGRSAWVIQGYFECYLKETVKVLH